ncbi:MAG: DUF6290 family protein [Raoultibacter sp.]
MGMTASAIRFRPEEKEWIDAFARLNGKSFSAQVRAWTLEKLEDEMDARDLSQAIEQSKADPTDTGIDLDSLREKYGRA